MRCRCPALHPPLTSACSRSAHPLHQWQLCKTCNSQLYNITASGHNKRTTELTGELRVDGRTPYISDLAQLPPSVSEIEMQMGRADFRLAHWMRAILPTVNLVDVPLVGFMPLPGSGDVLFQDGSNAAFDWGTPEQPARHLPKEVGCCARGSATRARRTLRSAGPALARLMRASGVQIG